MKVLLRVFLIFTAITSLHSADRWAPPETKVYYNSDSTYSIHIIPRTYPERYWEWRQASGDDKKEFKAEDTVITPCYAVKFKRTSSGDSLIWKKNLKNSVAPVSAYVSGDGKYVLTFDNWHSVGLGNHVFVIYDENGNLLKSYTLADISPYPINDYKATRSSLWWSCGKSFIDNKRIEICFVNQDYKEQKIVYNLELQKIE